MARKMDFADQIEKIIDAASKAGADTNVLYLTTLDRATYTAAGLWMEP